MKKVIVTISFLTIFSSARIYAQISDNEFWQTTYVLIDFVATNKYDDMDSFKFTQYARSLNHNNYDILLYQDLNKRFDQYEKYAIIIMSFNISLDSAKYIFDAAEMHIGAILSQQWVFQGTIKKDWIISEQVYFRKGHPDIEFHFGLRYSVAELDDAGYDVVLEMFKR